MNDLISRQDSINAVNNALMEWSCMESWRDAKIVDSLHDIPPAQQLIPCEERLPESTSERIILLYDNGLISGGKYLGNKTFDIDFRDNDKKTKVVAWMPLPSPYKGVEE